MPCSTCSDPLLIELTEIHSIYLLRESFRFQLHSLLFPLPDSEEIIRGWSHCSQHIPISTKVDTRIWFFSAFSDDSVQLQTRILIDENFRPYSFLSNSKIFFGRMNSYCANSSSIFAIENLFILCEMVIDCIGNTRTIDYCISVKNKGIVVFETIVSI